MKQQSLMVSPFGYMPTSWQRSRAWIKLVKRKRRPQIVYNWLKNMVRTNVKRRCKMHRCNPSRNILQMKILNDFSDISLASVLIHSWSADINLSSYWNINYLGHFWNDNHNYLTNSVNYWKLTGIYYKNFCTVLKLLKPHTNYIFM